MSIEDDPGISVYWTAIPEAMRDIVGDPIGDPISVSQFRDNVEKSLAGMETGLEWDDESSLSDVVGIIVTDDAESTASGLAMDLEAAAIYEHKETGNYLVCGSNINSEGSGFFPWVLVTISEDEDGDGLSDDAARWTPRLADAT
jgi:hypothetical protein